MATRSGARRKRRARVAARVGRGREAGVAIARRVTTTGGAAAESGSAAAAGRDAAAVPGAGSVAVATELHSVEGLEAAVLSRKTKAL